MKKVLTTILGIVIVGFIGFILIDSYKFESINMGVGTVGLPHNKSLWIGSYKSDRLAEASLSISE